MCSVPECWGLTSLSIEAKTFWLWDLLFCKLKLTSVGVGTNRANFNNSNGFKCQSSWTHRPSAPSCLFHHINYYIIPSSVCLHMDPLAFTLHNNQWHPLLFEHPKFNQAVKIKKTLNFVFYRPTAVHNALWYTVLEKTCRYNWKVNLAKNLWTPVFRFIYAFLIIWTFIASKKASTW